MKKTVLSNNDRHIVNCLLALCNWHEVHPRGVYLESWRCGTQACFGGHLATWPEFMEMGVFAGMGASPTMQNLSNPHYNSDALSVSMRLFGGDLFPSRLKEEPRHMNAHRLIVRRLERQIVALTS